MINNVSAGVVTWTDPKGTDLPNTGFFVINPANYTPQVYTDLYFSNNNATAGQFCAQNGGQLLSYTSRYNGSNYTNTFGGFWTKILSGNIINVINCEVPDNTITYEITDNKQGINKPIFDEDTIKSIYLIEVIIVFFIFFFQFFRRLQKF